MTLPQGEAKVKAVDTMFDTIAPRYELLNRLLTFGMDRRWRRLTVQSLGLPAGSLVLDLACGTGDLYRDLASAGMRAVGIDRSAGMLRAAREAAPSGRAAREAAPSGRAAREAAPSGRAAREAAPSGRAAREAAPSGRPARRAGRAPSAGGGLVRGDALCLPTPTASVDGAVCGFSLRNFLSLEPFLAECARAIRPGGRLALLEVAIPENPVLRFGHSVYFGQVVPVVGGLLSDRAAYRYLPRSVAYLPSVPQMLAMLADAGFPDVQRRTLSVGIAQLLTGTRA